MQIRTRLTLYYTLLAAFILAGVLLAVYFFYERDIEQRFIDELRTKVYLTTNSLLSDPAALKPPPPVWVDPEASEDLPYRDNISIYNSAYERIFSVHPEAVPVSPALLQKIWRQEEAYAPHYNLHALGRAISSAQHQPYIIVAEGYCDPTGLQHLRRILLLGFLAGLLLIAPAGWLFARRALAPVSDIMNTVDGISYQNLERRLPEGKSRDELSRLSATFNRLLGRVGEAFGLQRMFLSNVAHELRNPLTAMRTRIEVTLQKRRSPEAYETALQSVLEDVQMLSEMQDKLMQLARIHHNGSEVEMLPLRLDELLWHSIAALKKQHPAYKISFEVAEDGLQDAAEQWMIQGNEALLQVAFKNLIDNACKYGAEQRAQVFIGQEASGMPYLKVRDNGPGIPPEELQLIFEPFFRSTQHRKSAKGVGVGLALVRSIADLHKARIRAENNPDGGAVFIWEFQTFAPEQHSTTL